MFGCRARAELHGLVGGSFLAGLRNPRAWVFAAGQGRRDNLGSNAQSIGDEQLGIAAGLFYAGSSHLVAGVERDRARPGAAPWFLRRVSDGAQERVSWSGTWTIPGYWHERLVVQRVFNDGGWIIHTPHGDLYFEDHDYWAEALEREGPRYDQVPARVFESGDYLVSFGEPIGRIAFDALAIDALEAAKQECEAHPGCAPAEVPERIRNWNRSLRNAPGQVGAAADRLRRMVSGRPSRGPPEGYVSRS